MTRPFRWALSARVTTPAPRASVIGGVGVVLAVASFTLLGGATSS